MKTYVVYTCREGSPPEPDFAFHALNLDDARSKKDGWVRYHGMLPSEFGVEEYPAFREAGLAVHDEYVRHYGGVTKFLCFFNFRGPGDERPSLVECHAVSKKPTEREVRALLAEVAAQQFGGRPYKLWTGMRSTSASMEPLHGLAAEDAEFSYFLTPVYRKRYL